MSSYLGKAALTVLALILFSLSPFFVFFLLLCIVIICWPPDFQKHETSQHLQDKVSAIDDCFNLITGRAVRDSWMTFAMSRAIPNERLVYSFGIHNAFTSQDPQYCQSFRRHATNLLRELDGQFETLGQRATRLVGEADILATERDSGSTKLLVAPFVRLFVFKAIVPFLFPNIQFPESLYNTKRLTDAINEIWMDSKGDSVTKMLEGRFKIYSLLASHFPDMGSDSDPRKNPLNLILPAYETMWRAVLICFIQLRFLSPSYGRHLHDSGSLDAYRGEPTKENFTKEDGAFSIESAVKESLRLFPPTKTIYRAVPAHRTIEDEYRIVGADVKALQRDPSIWGDDAAKFLPARWSSFTSEFQRLNEKAYMPFGRKPYQCPAADIGPRIIGLLVAVLLAHVGFDGHAKLHSLRCQDGCGNCGDLIDQRDSFEDLHISFPGEPARKAWIRQEGQ